MIDIIHFYKVDSLENVRTFYEDILNLKLYKDQGQCLIYHLEGFGKVGFCTHHPKKKNDATCMTFVYDNKDAIKRWHAYFTEQGLKPSDIKNNETFKLYHFFVQDFEGIQLEFQVFL